MKIIKLKVLKILIWCGPSLVKAQNLLLKEAIKDKDNQHFIFVSNSCIPIKSFNYIYDKLDIEKSYFYKSKSARKNFEEMKGLKASQWSIICRKHVKLLLDVKNNYLYNKIFIHFTEKGRGHPNKFSGCPDEYSYITILNHLKLNKEIIFTNIEDNYPITYRSGYKEYKHFNESKKRISF